MAARNHYAEVVDELVAHLSPPPEPPTKPEPKPGKHISVYPDQPDAPDEPEGGASPSAVRPSDSAHLPSGAPRPPHEQRRILYFDLEIARSLDEVGGWPGAIREGGVSVACIWDSYDESPRFYGQDDLPALIQALEQADLVVTFNGAAFDIPLLRAHTRHPVALKAHFDLFLAVKEALSRNGAGWKGQGLGALSRTTLQRDKTGEGSGAPALLRAGQWAKLANYCLNDVILLRDLTTFARRQGYLLDKDGHALALTLPDGLRLDRGA